MLSSLAVKNNKIVDKKDKEIILRGASINDPYYLLEEEKHDFLEDIKNIKKFGFNTVRVVISPPYWQSKKDYITKVLDPIVNLCKKLNLYCIMDWHAHGNPLTNETRRPELISGGFMKYDARRIIAEKVALKLSKRYGREKHVLFEIFCNPHGIKWADWKTIAESIINKIRKNTKNIVIISGVNWFGDLSGVLTNPVKKTNIAYGVGIYPNYKNYKIVTRLKKKYPVIVTECGFIESSDSKEFVGETNVYGSKFRKFIFENKISWIAWIYHPFGYTSKASTLIKSWNPKDLSEWGKFVKKRML